MELKCWLCGRNGSADPLDKHHIFGGAYRAKSEQMGLFVYLCHHDCHIFGPEAAHRSAETMRKLHVYGQKLAMERFGWTEEEFRREFGKSYLSEEPAGEQRNGTPADAAPEAKAEVVVFGFALLPDAAELPY